MVNHDDHLKQYVREQIAIEESFCSLLEQQISEVNTAEYADAANLLIEAREVLGRNFVSLNKTLDNLEQGAVSTLSLIAGGNGTSTVKHLSERDLRTRRISKMLRDDYSALNLITMSNTLLHTTALALEQQEVAAIALKHLQNLAPIVVKIGALVPEVATRELHRESSKIDLSVGQIALKNTQLAWRNAG
jgi:hypothetical protein